MNFLGKWLRRNRHRSFLWCHRKGSTSWPLQWLNKNYAKSVRQFISNDIWSFNKSFRFRARIDIHYSYLNTRYSIVINIHTNRLFNFTYSTYQNFSPCDGSNVLSKRTSTSYQTHRQTLLKRNRKLMKSSDFGDIFLTNFESFFNQHRGVHSEN